MGSLNRAQRVVLVVALGVALAVIGRFIEGGFAVGAVGWVGYTPLSRGFVFPRGRSWGDLLLWLVLTATWAAASIVILRTRRPSRVHPSDRSSDTSRSA
jgi:hypothetical protein